MDRELGRAAELLDCRLIDPETLGGSDRSTVLRARTDRADLPTVVIKWFARRDGATNSGGYGYLREYAGLQTIPGTPELVAVDHELCLLIMTDVGTGAHLSDVLLGEDADLALRAAADWAAGLGRLCAESGPHVDPFRAVITERDPDSRSRGGPPSPRLADEGLARLQQHLRFPDDDAVRGELAWFTPLLEPDQRDAVVTPGDFCPDNVIMTDGGPRFIDLEGSSVHHLALDAVYASMPFGTCWCLYDAPAGFTDHLMGAFTDAARPELAATLADPDWPVLLQAAGAYTVLMMSELSWEAAQRDVQVSPIYTTPRQRLAARWRWAAEALTELPRLREGFARAAEWAEGNWAPEWPRYPAFRG